MSSVATATTSANDTFETYRSLPDDFAYDYKLQVGASGTQPQDYTPIAFEDKYSFQYTSGYYYIDLANDRYALTGIQVDGETIYLFYIKDSAEITEDSSWVFPSRFHALLAIKTAFKIAEAPEHDEINDTIAKRIKGQAKTLKDAMELWDTNLKLRTMNHSFRNGDTRGYTDGHVNNSEYQ